MLGVTLKGCQLLGGRGGPETAKSPERLSPKMCSTSDPGDKVPGQFARLLECCLLCASWTEASVDEVAWSRVWRSWESKFRPRWSPDGWSRKIMIANGMWCCRRSVGPKRNDGSAHCYVPTTQDTRKGRPLGETLRSPLGTCSGNQSQRQMHPGSLCHPDQNTRAMALLESKRIQVKANPYGSSVGGL